MKDFTITDEGKYKALFHDGEKHALTRVCAGIAFAEDEQHAIVVLAEDEKRKIWVVAEHGAPRRDEFFRHLSMAAGKYFILEGYHQPDRWATSMAQTYQRWVTDNKPEHEMRLYPDPDGLAEDDAPRLIAILETGMEKTRRHFNPKCKGLADELRLLGQPREQLRRTFRQHPLMHAMSLGLSGLAFFNPPKVSDISSTKRRVMLHEQILSRSGRICI